MNILPVATFAVRNNQANKQQSFSGNPFVRRDLPLMLHQTKGLADKFLKGTSGCRGEYGKELTLKHSLMLGLGFVKFVKDTQKKNLVMVGGDERSSSKEVVPALIDLYRKMGVSVIASETESVPTPLIAYTCMSRKILGTLETASHNPWKDLGQNFITAYGTIAPYEMNKQIAENMIDFNKQGFYRESLLCGDLTKVDIFPEYEKYMSRISNIDWDMIRKSGVSIHYDGLHGAGTQFVKRLFAEKDIPLNVVNSSVKEGPNPTDANLPELKNAVKNDKSILKLGLANDGDADRFGLVDENGTFIDANDVLLLLAHHLKNNKGKSGDIVKNHATTDLLTVFAENNGLKTIQTPVGFKFLGEEVLNAQRDGKPVLLAGEQSGGMTFGTYMPEKDGIVAISFLAELVAKEQKPISKILTNIKSDLGVVSCYDNISRTISDTDKFLQIQDNVKSIYNAAVAGKKTIFDYFGLELNIPATKKHARIIEKYKDGGDGVKFIFGEKSSLLIRKSGTEPKSRGIIEAIEKNAPEANNIFNRMKSVFNEIMK